MAGTGYNIGSAYVQVRPSFDGFQQAVAAATKRIGDVPVNLDPKLKHRDLDRELAKISDSKASEVDLKPQLDGSKLAQELHKVSKATSKANEIELKPHLDGRAVAKEIAELDRATSKANEIELKPRIDRSDVDRALARITSTSAGAVTVEAELDERKIITKLNEIKARSNVTEFQIEADTKKFQAQIRDLQHAKRFVNVDVDAETATAEAALAALQAERQTSLTVEADITRARAEIDQLKARHRFMDVSITADISKAQQRIRWLRDQPHDTEIDVDAETARAEEKIRKLTADRPVQDIKFDADLREAYSKLAQLQHTQTRKVVDVDADITAVQARLAELEQVRPHMSVDIDGETAALQAKLAMLQARRERIQVQVEADTASAMAQLAAVRQMQKSIGGDRTHVGMESNDVGQAVFMMGALLTAISAVGAAAPGVAAAVAMIPNAVIGAGQVVGALAGMFSGVGDAVKAMQAVEDDATTRATSNAKSRVSAANRIEGAQSSLERAQSQADRSAVQGAQRVAQAREGLARAHEGVARAVESASAGQEQSLRRVADAERALTQSQQSARDAQEALNRAREDARERIENLSLSLKGAALDEEAAVIALEKAQQRLAQARAAGAGGLELREAELGARQAAHALAEVRERYGDIQAEASAASRNGVEGDRAVVAAHRGVSEANQRVSDAERDLVQTRRDAARDAAKAQQQIIDAQRQVASAQQDVVSAQQSAAQAQQDAARSVADAQRQVAAASQNAGAEGAAAMDKLNLAMSDLTPAGQSFARFLQNEAKPALQDIGDAIQTAGLPKMEEAFRKLLELTPLMSAKLADTASVIGDLTLAGAEMMTSGPWTRDMATIMDTNNRMLRNFGFAGLEAMDAFRNIGVVVSPIMEDIARGIEKAATGWAANVQRMRDNGDLAVFFAKAQDSLSTLWSTVKQFSGAIWDLMQALAPLGKIILEIVGHLAELIGNFAAAHPTITQVGVAIGIAAAAALTFGRGIGGLFTAIGQARSGFTQLRTSILGTSTAADGTTRVVSTLGESTTRAGRAINGVLHPVNAARGAIGTLATAYQSGAVAGENMAARLVGSTTTTVGTLNNLRAPAGLAATSIGGVGRAIDGIATPVSRMPAIAQTFGAGLGEMSRVVSTATTQMTTRFRGGIESMARVAGGVGATIGTTVKNGLSGITGFLGGPWGVAFAVGTLALGAFMRAQQQAAQSAAEHKAKLQGFTQALVESNGTIDESVRKQALMDLSQGGLIKKTQSLGLSVGGLTDAVLSGGSAATTFEDSLRGMAEKLAISAGAGDGAKAVVDGLYNTYGTTGEAANIFKNNVDLLATAFQKNTGASDAATDSFRQQVTDLFSLRQGYMDSSGTWQAAKTEQEGIAAAQGGAAAATQEHARSITTLSDTILGTIDANLAYRSAVQQQEAAHRRVTEAITTHGAASPEYQAAVLAEEQAIWAQVRAAGEVALKTSDATDENVRNKDASIAMAQEAANVANTFKGPLPASLQEYIDKNLIARDETGKYIVKLGEVPSTVTTDAQFNDEAAREGIRNYKSWAEDYLGILKAPAPTGIPGMNLGWSSGGNAQGNLLEPFGRGGFASLTPMAAGAATVVPANTWRVIGDRMQGDEAYIPINDSPRSQQILVETARRMGFDLVPMMVGGLLGMAAGGVAAPAARPSRTGEDPAAVPSAITMTPEQINAITAAVTVLRAAIDVLTTSVLASRVATDTLTTSVTESRVATDTATVSNGLLTAASNVTLAATDALNATIRALTAVALLPLSTEITNRTVPALQLLQTHAGILSVQSIQTLSNQLPPLRSEFSYTADIVQWAWQRVSNDTYSAMSNVSSYLDYMRYALELTGTSFERTSDWIRDSWGKVHGYVREPTVAAIDGPINKGIIAAWNFLDNQFQLGKHVAEVPIGFAVGGRVPGVGNQDSVPAMLTPGEYVWSKEAIKNLGGLATVDNLHQMARAGIVGPNATLGDGAVDGRERLSLMRKGSLDDLPGQFAYGGVQPHVALAGDEITRVFGRMPGGIGGVGSRGNVSDHPTGHALDFMTMSDSALGDKVAGYLLGNAQRLLLKYAIWKQQINEGSGWSKMEDRGSITANHFDHVHASFLRAGEAGRAFAGGGMFDPAAVVNEAFAGAYRMIDEYAAARPGNIVAAQNAGMAREAADRIKQVAIDKLSMSMMGGTPGSGPVVDQVRAVAQRYGWGEGSQWDALARIIQKESSWNPSAKNPTSTAYGLFQFLDSTWGAYGFQKTDNPALQAEAGLSYIRQRYGDPLGALAFHQSHNWYDGGGWLPPGYSTVANHTGKPEAVLTSDQWNSITRLAEIRGGGDGRQITVNARTDASPDHIAHSVDRHLALGTRL